MRLRILSGTNLYFIFLLLNEFLFKNFKTMSTLINRMALKNKFMRKSENLIASDINIKEILRLSKDNLLIKKFFNLILSFKMS